MGRVWLPAWLAMVCGVAVCRAQPTVRLVYPSEHPERGLIAYGDVSLTADAVDHVFGVERVDFYIDGQQVFSDRTYPYSYLWSAADIRRGLYNVKVVARNTRGDAAAVEAGIEVVPSPPKRRTGGTAVENGLLPPMRPILEVNMRDPSVTRGPDGVYYLVGTTGHDAGDMNGGVAMWTSEDLAQWDYVGLIWSFERDGTWQRPWGLLHGKPFRAAWAPQLVFARGKLHLLFHVPGRGTALLASTTGKPEGPYRNVRIDDDPVTPRGDSSLFVDDDGSVYLLFEGGFIVPLDEKWNFAGPPRRLGVTGDRVRLFKREGRYHVSATRIEDCGRYSAYLASSDTLSGPFADWHEAVPCGGGGNFFQDADGRWWATFFGNDKQAPWEEWPALLRVDFEDDGRAVLPDDPCDDQCDLASSESDE